MPTFKDAHPEMQHLVRDVTDAPSYRVGVNAAGHEERRVVVDGHEFVLECAPELGEWSVCWVEPPADCHPQLGALGWRFVPEATQTTGLDVVNIDMQDSARKEELLYRVAVEAGLSMRPTRYLGQPNADAEE